MKALSARARGGRGDVGGGRLAQTVPFGPGGQDVVAELLDRADRPQEQRAHGLFGDRLGGVLAARRGRRQ